ncbi:MAG: hypothetical protein ACOYM2_06880 [Rectinemataceae bacterium]
MDDTDLSGLDLAGARAYLVDFATSSKLARNALTALDGELALWTARVALAEGKAMAELAASARAKLSELEGKRAPLAAELAETEDKVRRIREKLPLVAASERSIDADRLLAELQLMTGELLGDNSSRLEADMAALESEVAVEAGLAGLKKDAGQDQPRIP